VSCNITVLYYRCRAVLQSCAVRTRTRAVVSVILSVYVLNDNDNTRVPCAVTSTTVYTSENDNPVKLPTPEGYLYDNTISVEPTAEFHITLLYYLEICGRT